MTYHQNSYSCCGVRENNRNRLVFSLKLISNSRVDVIQVNNQGWTKPFNRHREPLMFLWNHKTKTCPFQWNKEDLEPQSLMNTCVDSATKPNLKLGRCVRRVLRPTSPRELGSKWVLRPFSAWNIGVFRMSMKAHQDNIVGHSRNWFCGKLIGFGTKTINIEPTTFGARNIVLLTISVYIMVHECVDCMSLTMDSV